MEIREHPGILLPAFRRYILILFLLGSIQILWAIGVLYLLANFSRSEPLPRLWLSYIQLSWLSGVYIISCTLLAFLIHSRNWMKAAVITALIPGPGILFGLINIPIAFEIYREIRKNKWEKFFAWNNRERTIKRLTARKPE